MRSAIDLVTLTDGQAVSLQALQVGWTLEARGVSLRIDEDRLAVGPRELLTDADRAAIRAHRDELLALVRYIEVM
jgi:hypothetical protein